jgi:hypothetical protein
MGMGPPDTEFVHLTEEQQAIAITFERIREAEEAQEKIDMMHAQAGTSPKRGFGRGRR